MFNPRRLIGLSLLLTACGGSPGPSGQPQPQPPALSSIGGVVESPGGRAGAALGGGQIVSRPSWWTQGAEVERRRAAAGATQESVIPGQFIVKLRPGLAAQTSRSSALLARLTVNGAALTLVRPLGPAGLGLYRAPAGLSGTGRAALLSGLAARPDVVYAEPDRWMHAMKTPTDTFYPVQWGAQAMNLPAAWDITTGSAVTVAVVD